MKKILMAIAVLGFSFSVAQGQDFQSIYKSLTHFSSVYPPPEDVPVKPVVHVHKKRKIKKPPEIQQNFQVCEGHSRYFICNQVPVDSNSTHPMLARRQERVKFDYDGLYDLKLDPRSLAKTHKAPVGQSYPGRSPKVSPSSYVVLYPKVNYIESGTPHKAPAGSHLPYEKVPRSNMMVRSAMRSATKTQTTPQQSFSPKVAELIDFSFMCNGAAQ
jgi:hypothetical protein